MEIKSYAIKNDGSYNLIIGMSHFIKTVDDLAEIINSTCSNAEYAVVFCEASGSALIRHEGNDKDLVEKGIEIMQTIKAGHIFAILLKNCFPISILAKVKMCDEVVRIFCATANPITVLSVEANEGAAVIGVIDGISPKGVENDDDKKIRRDFLKKVGYKF